MDHYSSSASIMKITYIRDEKNDIKNPVNSVRKPIAKPWKKEVVPPKVYRVHSKNFSKVVQRLTGAPDQSPESKRLKSLAPPPIETTVAAPLPDESGTLLSSSGISPLTNFWREIYNDLNDFGKGAQVAKTTGISVVVPSSFSGLRSPSPCTFNTTWPPSFPFLSPGTLASFDDATTVP